MSGHRKAGWLDGRKPRAIGAADAQTVRAAERVTAARPAAQEAAHRVLGVLVVANGVQVRFYARGPRNDADIAQAVRDTLEWNVFVPAARIGRPYRTAGDSKARSSRGSRVRAARHRGLRRRRHHLGQRPPGPKGRPPSRAARGTPGVRSVRDDIRIEP